MHKLTWICRCNYQLCHLLLSHSKIWMYYQISCSREFVRQQICHQLCQKSFQVDHSCADFISRLKTNGYASFDSAALFQKYPVMRSHHHLSMNPDFLSCLLQGFLLGICQELGALPQSSLKDSEENTFFFNFIFLLKYRIIDPSFSKYIEKI